MNKLFQDSEISKQIVAWNNGSSKKIHTNPMKVIRNSEGMAFSTAECLISTGKYEAKFPGVGGGGGGENSNGENLPCTADVWIFLGTWYLS